MERVINRTEKEYLKLELVAKALEMESPNNAKYIVEDVYLDFGQNWMWTTICRYGYKECQVLYPRDWENIMMAETAEELIDIVKDIRSGKFFGDK